jgi:nucleotide-binding universal stress UspA family protein
LSQIKSAEESFVVAIPKKLLVGVDDSEGSKRAVEFAVALSEKIGSSLVFIHIVTLADSGKQILQASESKAKEKNVPSKSFLEVGDPTKIILAKAETEGCDCIVVGKEGQPKVEGDLVSSTTALKLTTLAKIPVISV